VLNDAGYRVHKSSDDAVGSLLLGLYTDDGTWLGRRDRCVPDGHAAAVVQRNAIAGTSFDTRPLDATINGDHDHRPAKPPQGRAPTDPGRAVDHRGHRGRRTVRHSTHRWRRHPARQVRGLLQRVENAYKDIPHHNIRLQRRADNLANELDDYDNTSLGELEHADQLSDKRLELSTLTAQLRMEAQSEAAQAASAAARERIRESGRKPGRTLERSPTPALPQWAATSIASINAWHSPPQ
jgi:hypothetical protein